jgi:hypothetical protein
MSTRRVLTLCLIVPGLLLTGCASKVSGRFDMQQRFAAGLEVQKAEPKKDD